MKTAIIIDDEPLARMVVAEYLSKHEEISILAECSDGFEGVKKINELKPDLIFLDIQMPKINGFEMLELLDYIPAIIFTTAFDEYAIKAFDNNAIDYLLKPFGQERFNKAIAKWQTANNQLININSLIENTANLSANSHRIIVKTKGKIKIIPAETVFYLEASVDFVKIFTADGQHLKSKTMQYFENSLDPATFVRVHRSYLVNINYVTRLELYEKDSYLAILNNNSKIPVSKTGYQKLKAVMGI